MVPPCLKNAAEVPYGCRYYENMIKVPYQWRKHTICCPYMPEKQLASLRLCTLTSLRQKALLEPPSHQPYSLVSTDI